MKPAELTSATRPQASALLHRMCDAAIASAQPADRHRRRQDVGSDGPGGRGPLAGTGVRAGGDRGCVAASHAIRMQTFDSVFKIFGLTDSEGPLHPRTPTLDDFPIVHQINGKRTVRCRVWRSANGRSWPIVSIQHAALKPPLAKEEKNQTPINNEGV
jgi:hypothetical protein